ncbi:hypothetical protein [Dyella sp. EPa41]|uniref:hypothetical protein n=1 Tax=Dyella sp. EPa41 TaxID=1561194 RepID=UPI001916301B|nr:hypothetical protein [Dyella sp. EPa41]
MDYFIATLALCAAAVAWFGDIPKKEDATKRATYAKHATAILALVACGAQCVQIYKNETTKEIARKALKQGEARAVYFFLRPIALFHGDYLGGIYIKNVDLNKVMAPNVLDALQDLCFSDKPKNVKSFPSETWGEEFADGIQSGISELNETRSLYQAYMTPTELQTFRDIAHDRVVEELLAHIDYSKEKESILFGNGSCAGMRPIDNFKRYIQHIIELQQVIARDGT